MIIEETFVVRVLTDEVRIGPLTGGPPGPPGPAGAAGPQGPPGSDGSNAEQWFNFASPALVWEITHDFGKAPTVQPFTPDDDPINAGSVVIDWPTPTTVTVSFYNTTAGKVRLT